MVYTAHKSTPLIDPYSIPQDCGAKHLTIQTQIFILTTLTVIEEQYLFAFRILGF
jgi:hypothetical protein